MWDLAVLKCYSRDVTRVGLSLTFLTCLTGFGQQPLADKYATGELIKIVADRQTPYFEYTIMEGCGYVGGSKTPIRVRENTEVRFEIEGKSMYVIDEKGKVRRLR